jgi:hypothetical protein
VKNGKERWKQEKKIQAQSENVCIDAWKDMCEDKDTKTKCFQTHKEQRK